MRAKLKQAEGPGALPPPLEDGASVVASDGIEPARMANAADLITAARQDYLNALPIAAALVWESEGRPTVIAANEKYQWLDGMSLHAGGRGGEPAASLIEREPLRSQLSAFLASGEPALEFDWYDGDGVGGRHFIGRVARLLLSADSERRCVLSLIDRTAEIENERSLRAEMLHDSLTGLPNRVAFNEAVERALAESDPDDPRFAVIAVDLNRFSRINESMGSIAGDELIITVARRIVGALRTGDMLARTGGDEFSILFRVAESPNDVLVAGRRLQTTMVTPFRLSDLEIRVDCAIGCALMSKQVAGAEDLVRNAQFALKRAKRSGRIEVYRPGEVSEALRRLSLETELRRAIENDALTLAFQPLVDLATGTVAGYEALARWNHPERGPIGPNEFIPVAEESGLIVPLGRWALDAATRTLAAWDRQVGAPLPVNIAVNLSPIQLARDDVTSAVQGALARSGISGDRLTLELTESAIIRDPEAAMRTLQGLKDLEAKIAMDDFGTGYSSLAHLQKLPIDVLKIDRSFITGMIEDRDSLAIVRAVLSLASALGMRTTAEGVETAELAGTLAALGCTLGQGYYFARPLEPAAALDYLLERSG